MNCSFCARAGPASAATPTSDASTIPTRFPIIGSSIDTPEVATRGAADPASGYNCRGPQYEPQGVGVSSSDLPRIGSDLPRQARRIAEGRPRAGGPKRLQIAAATLATAGTYLQVKNL